MKKLFYPFAFALSAFLILYSCSTEEEDTTPPPQVQQPTPETEPEVSQYTLTVTAGEGGTVSTEGGTYDEGTSVTITATPAEGYAFLRWSNGQTDQSINYTLNSNTSLTAVFEKLFYTLKTNEILIDDPEYNIGTFAVMIYHTSISGSFMYSHNGNEYLFIPGMAACENAECENANDANDVEPKPGLHFKKTTEGWQLLRVYDEVKTWGIRNFKVKDNFIAMGDGNEIGPGPWKGDMWFGEILGDEIIWKKINTAEEQSWHHGTTMGDLNNDGLMDIGGAPGRYVSGDINYNESDEVADCETFDGTNGGNEFYIFLQNQNGEFSSVDVINYPLGENGCRLFQNGHYTIEFENLDEDPEDEIIVSSYKDFQTDADEDWKKNNLQNLVVYDLNNANNKFEMEWNSKNPYVFYPDFGNNDHFGTTSIKVADFNNDGVKDISVAREYIDDFSFDIWLGNGNGTFEPYSYVRTGWDLIWREFDLLDVDNDGDIDIVLRSNFGYFTKDKETTDDGYNWGITGPNEAGVNPNSPWKGILLNELIWINDGTGRFSMYDEKPLYIGGIFPQQLKPYKVEDKFYLLGYRNFGYNEQNQLKTEFYDIELNL